MAGGSSGRIGGLKHQIQGEGTGEGDYPEHGVQLVDGDKISKKARGQSLSFAPG
jgi:hypothetical protein